MKKFKIATIMLIIITFCTVGIITVNATDAESTETEENTGTVLYNSHIRNQGWEEDFSKKDGEESGTTGKNLALEAIQIKLNNLPEEVGLKYQVHVQDIGWMDWVNEGEVAGTTGKAKKIEAIRIQLENTEDYSIEYSAHVQDIGWQDWAIDGEMAGTTGKNKKIEAIKIRVIPNEVRGKVSIETVTDPVYENTINISGWAMANAKDTVLETYIDDVKIESNITYSVRKDIKEIGYGGIENTEKPGFSTSLDISNITDGEKILKVKLLTKDGKQIAEAQKTIKIEKDTLKVKYVSHVENVGWQDWVYQGATSGTNGRNLQVEAMKIQLAGNIPEGASIKYQIHVKNIGWMDWQADGALSGTEGQNKRIEAIRIKLENLDEYSIEYRAHVQNIGWQPWAIDGEMAGTSGKKLQIEAIEIRIIPKTVRAGVKIETNTDKILFDENIGTISGWAMANTTNTTLETYIDDQKIDSNIEYFTRTDVTEIGYGGIENTPEQGFNASLDLSNVADGEHALTVKMLDNTGKEIANTSKTIKVDKTTVGIKYETHVAERGWGSSVRGETQSNDGGSKIEAIKIRLVGDLPENATVKYQAHVQDVGWQDWVSNNGIAGTTGKAKKIEALRIKLENVDNKYSVEYNAFVQGIGWQGWAYDGEIAGTTGQDKRIETIKIRIVNKITEKRSKMYVDKPVMDGISVVNVKQTNTIVAGWAMTNVQGTNTVKIKIDGNDTNAVIVRVARQDVLDLIKGYGGVENNPLPGFTTTINFKNYSVGNHTMSIQVLAKDGTLLCSTDKTINVQPNIVFETGTYGYSGLAIRGSSQGTALPYYRFGNGPNVMFATFAIHGWEDQWAGDGSALIKIAEDFKNMLLANQPTDIHDNWTIYIFPGVNRDGVYLGSTNNGPGRTTLYSAAPGHKGIDINRCWQTSATYKRHTDNRNYNGTAACQAYEASALRTFLLNHKSTSGQTVLVDLHGWLNETLGDNGIGSHYRAQYGLPKHIGSYGEGYLINWAHQNLGANGRVARSTLVELPAVGNQAQADARGYSAKYYNATLSMLRAAQ